MKITLAEMFVNMAMQLAMSYGWLQTKVSTRRRFMSSFVQNTKLWTNRPNT